MHLVRTLFVAATLAVAAPVFAHTDDWFDSNPSPNGGQVRMAGPYHFELMPQQAKDGVQVLVTDHASQKIATDGWSASAIVLDGGKKVRITLKPAGDNILAGTGKLGGADAQIVISVKDKGGKGYSARFTPGAAAMHAHSHDHDQAPAHDHEHSHDHEHMHDH